MPNHTPTLSDHDVLTHAREGLSKHLPLAAAGYKCTTDDLLNVLLGVAANRGTLESVCNDRSARPMQPLSAVISMKNCAWKTYPTWRGD